jgi:hypothetical protein
MNLGDLWEAIGSLDELESAQILVQLFNRYEELLKKDPDNREAQRFFENLGQTLSLVTDCNLNRR